MTSGLANEFDLDFQKKVVVALVYRQQFLEQVYDIIKVEYFDSESVRWAVETTLNYYADHRRCPTSTVFKTEGNLLPKDSPMRAAILELYRYLFSTTTPTDLDYVQEKFLEFCKFQELKNAFIQGVDMLQRDDVSKSGRELIQLFNRAAQAGESQDIGQNYHDALDHRASQTSRKTIATPWDCLNRVTDGGLGAGELGCIIAPSGIGKSWFLRKIAAHAMQQGYTVADFTFELSEEYVGLRYDSLFTGIAPNKIKFNVDDVRNKINQVPGKTFIKYMPVRSATAHTLGAHMKRMVSRGFTADLAIVDYADLMRAIEKSNAKHEELGYIYEEIRSVLAEFGIPGWTASQAQRSATKDEVIEADKIAGAYSKIMACDLIISANRTTQDKADKTTRVHVVKNRNGPDGMTFPAIMDLENAIIELYDASSPEGIQLMEKIQGEWVPIPSTPRGFDPARI
jgi:hypothetical protein